MAAEGFAVIRRRRFLRWGLGAGASLAGGGAAAYLSLFGVAPARRGLRVLSDREHRTLRNLVTTIAGPVAMREREAIADAFDGFLAGEPPDVVSDLSSALVWLELGPVLYDRRWASFSDLEQAAREAHFGQWMRSEDLVRRQVATAFRKFVNLVFYDTPASWARIRYPGPATGLREP
ncbi:MAG: hypothetical protein KF729_01725 [Sandaracinaceae bacterium]|nr:hypothetical protein [Sandaracinaceae bacterium]